MRKQTQLADLILGSGLVGDSTKRQSGPEHEDGTAGRPQSAGVPAHQGPALYQFGVGRSSSRRPQSASRPASASSQHRSADASHHSKPGDLMVGSLSRPPHHPVSVPTPSPNPTNFHVQTLELGGAAASPAQDVQYVALPGSFSGGKTLQPSRSHSRGSSTKSLPTAWSHADVKDQQPAIDSPPEQREHSGIAAAPEQQQMWASHVPGPVQPDVHQEELPWTLSDVTDAVDLQPPQHLIKDISSHSSMSLASSSQPRSQRASLDGRLQLSQTYSGQDTVHSKPPPGRASQRSSQPPARKAGPDDEQGQCNSGALSKVSSAQEAVRPSQDELQLRLKVSALETQVAGLKQELVCSQAETQAVAQQAAAAAAKWEQDKGDAALRSLRLIKQAEQAQERAEVGRRMAERRAAEAENEVHQLKSVLSTKDAQHQQVVSGLQSTIDMNQAASKSHATVLEGLIAGLREELQTVRGQKQADSDSEKKGLQEAVEKQRQEVARRTQTILSLTSECESLQKQRAACDAKQAELEGVIASLQQQLQISKDMQIATARHSQRPASDVSTLPSSTAASVRSASSEAADSTARHCSPNPARPPSSSGKSRSNHSSSPGPANHQDLQTQIARIRQEHAERIVSLEAAVKESEAAAREAVHNCQQLFQALVDRTAHMLAGRLGTEGDWLAAHSDASSTISTRLLLTPRNLLSSSGSDNGAAHQPLVQRPPTPTKKASAAAAAAGNEKLALLYAMNDKLSGENARLLAELARFHSGKHPLLRRASMTVLVSSSSTTADMATASSAPASTSSTAAGLLRRSISDSNNGPTASSPRTSACGSASSKPAESVDSSSAQRGISPAKSALSLAVKEVLLCSRQQLLPAVMTSEGWEGLNSKQSLAQSHMNTKADTVLACAEQLTQLQAQHVVLQAEVVRLQAQLVSQGNDATAKAQSQVSDKASLSQLTAELATSQKRVAALEEQLRSARYGYVPGSAGGASFTTAPSDKDAEARIQSARDEAQHHRNTAAVAARERDALERQLDEQRQTTRALEQQLRESKVRAHEQEQTVKRVRALLGNARSLLRDAGIAFMEDDVTPAARQDTSLPTSRASSTTGEPGSLFKAVEAREKDKEVQRVHAELADWQFKANAASKELKLLKSQMSKKETELKRALAEAQAEAAREIGALKHEAADAADATKQAERKASEWAAEASQAQRTCQELTSKVEKLQVQAEYLKQRATQLRHQRPRLTFASALNMSISAQQMSQ